MSDLNSLQSKERQKIDAKKTESETKLMHLKHQQQALLFVSGQSSFGTFNSNGETSKQHLYQLGSISNDFVLERFLCAKPQTKHSIHCGCRFCKYTINFKDCDLNIDKPMEILYYCQCLTDSLINSNNLKALEYSSVRDHNNFIVWNTGTIKHGKMRFNLSKYLAKYYKICDMCIDIEKMIESYVGWSIFTNAIYFIKTNGKTKKLVNIDDIFPFASDTKFGEIIDDANIVFDWAFNTCQVSGGIAATDNDEGNIRNFQVIGYDMRLLSRKIRFASRK